MNRLAPPSVSTTAVLRYGLSLSAAAALLAGCGGSQPPLGVSPQKLSTQQSHAHATYDILHEFGRLKGDGTNPSADLINVEGALYGTTTYGGAKNAGTAFSITKSGKETVLHSFGGSNDGWYPVAALLNVKGTLYGTTTLGGGGDGTVFSITPDGTEKVLHAFPYYGNGYPRAALTDVNGTLYGTTSQNFYSSVTYGSVFSITTGGKFKVLKVFHDLANPEAALVDMNGILYGTTNSGGQYSDGSVFSISTAGKYHLLYAFGKNYPNDGAGPQAGLTAVDGTLYGTTVGGGPDRGGTVFSITTDGKLKTIYGFGGSDGSNPVADLIYFKGVLYGTTSKGGMKNVGTVFRVTTSGEETVLHSFSAGSGENPQAGLLEVGGTLYGTTYGAAKNHHGNIFSLKP